MLQFTDQNLQTVQNARNLKAKQIRTARKYLSTARSLGLSDKSVSVQHWQRVLQSWRLINVDVIVECMIKGGVS